MSIRKWEEEDRDKLFARLTDREKELLKDATLPQLKSYGALDQDTIEGMIVGFMVGTPKDDAKKTMIADKIMESGIKQDWFENKDFGILFKKVTEYYKTERKLLIPEVAEAIARCAPATATEAANYKLSLMHCHATVLARNLTVEPIIELVVCNYLQKTQDRIYERAVKERNDPKIGPQQSFRNMRNTCVQDLIDPRGAVIKEYDWMGSCEENVGWMLDMKENPEKYRGLTCGINSIDSKTEGFRSGQLTVIVGSHGGFKTTCMLNIAFGLYERGANVLYASLEMESQIVQLKLWARAAGISWTRCYNGDITEPEDWVRMEAIERILKGLDITEAHKKSLSRLRAMDQESLFKYLNKLRSATYQVTPETADSVKIKAFYDKMASRPNKLKIINVGQSEKMRMAQLDQWLRENQNVFKPNVVILDYLDLVQPENPNPDRPDLGLGDICKMARQMGKNMGFAVVTAAQLKRAAIDRIRKNGLENPEKAALGTDDISGSSQIGADADNVFILWREKSGCEVKLFTAKSRYKGADQTTGAVLQVFHDSCTMSDKDIETTEHQSKCKTPGQAYQTVSNLAKGNTPYIKTPDDEEEFPDMNFTPPLVDDGEQMDLGDGKTTPPDDGLDL